MLNTSANPSYSRTRSATCQFVILFVDLDAVATTLVTVSGKMLGPNEDLGRSGGEAW
jgi:hypothetical protein